MIPPFDQQLSHDLARLMQALRQRQQTLYASGHGCACDENGLCALHAEVCNRLAEAAYQLDVALQAIHKPA